MDGTHARQQDQAETSRTAPARAETTRQDAAPPAWRREPEGLSPAALLSLQGLAGNSAVSQLVTGSALPRIAREPLALLKPALMRRVPPVAPVTMPAPPPMPAVVEIEEHTAEDSVLTTDDLAAPEASAEPPSLPPSDGSTAAPEGYEASKARAEVQQKVTQLESSRQAHTDAIQRRAGEARQQVLQSAVAQTAGIRAAVLQQKASVAAGFAGKRQQLKAEVQAERGRMEAAAEGEHQSIETSSATRIESFTAETEAHRTEMHTKLEQERARPAAIAHADAARAETDVAAAAREARAVGRREAMGFAQDDSGRAQAAAATRVANETADDIAAKGPSIGRELRGGAPEVDQKHAEYASNVDRQVVDAVPKVTQAIHAETQAAAGELHTMTSAAIQHLEALEQQASAALSSAEASALALIESSGRKQTAQVTQAAQQVAAAIERSSQAQRNQLDERSAQVSRDLLSAEAPDPTVVDEVIANELTNLAAAAAGAQDQIGAATGHALKGFADLGIHVEQALGGLATAASHTAEEGLKPVRHQVHSAAEKRASSANALVTALNQQHQTIAKESLDQIKSAAAQAVSGPTQVNDRFAADSAKSTEQSVGKAKEPLSQLGGNVKAAAAKAKEEHERSLFAQIGMGILKALGGILIGLVIVIALALVVAFVVGLFGVALTAFGAMMIAGAILLAAGAIYAFYQRSTNPETANMNIAARLGLALSDATGLTALVEGVSNHAMGTWKPLKLDAEARSEKITTGLVSIVMLALAAKGGGSSPYLRPIELPAAGLKGGSTAAGAVGAEFWSGARLAGEGMRDWVKAKLGPDTSTAPTSTASSTTSGPAATATGPRPTRLPDLIRVLTDEAQARGDAVGADKIGFIERDPSGGMSQALKTDFFRRVDARLQADPKLTVWDAMKQVIKADPKAFLFKGDDIPPSVIDEHGGMTRIIDLESVHKYMLDPNYKASHRTFQTWILELRKDPSIFDPMRDCDPAALLSGKDQVGWWVPRSRSGQYSLVELVVDLALQRGRYSPGTVRFTLDAVAAKMVGFKRPTPFDGIEFSEWAEADSGSVFGVTEGGTPEAVAPAVPVSQVVGGHVIVPSGPYLPPALGGATVPSDVQPDKQRLEATVGIPR